MMTAFGLGDPRLPGLYTFRSATFGDGLFLPLLAYALVASAAPPGSRSRFQRVFGRAGFATGALLGLSVQAAALIDPDSRLDWTFPAQHSYNVPGWYHAAFLIVASGFYGRGFALVLSRIRDEAREDTGLALRRVRSAGVLAVLVPGFAFLGLLEEDVLAGLQRMGFIVLATLLVLAAVVCALLTWACGRRGFRWCVLSVLGSLLPAVTLCDLFLPGHGVSLPVAPLVGAAGLGIVAVARAVMQRRAVARGPVAHLVLSSLAVCQAVCAIGPVYAALTAREVTIVRISVGLAVSVLLACGEWLVLRAIIRARQYQPYAPS